MPTSFACRPHQRILFFQNTTSTRISKATGSFQSTERRYPDRPPHPHPHQHQHQHPHSHHPPAGHLIDWKRLHLTHRRWRRNRRFELDEDVLLDAMTRFSQKVRQAFVNCNRSRPARIVDSHKSQPIISLDSPFDQKIAVCQIQVLPPSNETFRTSALPTIFQPPRT